MTTYHFCRRTICRGDGVPVERYEQITMGAVLLLVLLPIVAAVGFILKTVMGEGSGGALLAGFAFLMLSGFLTAAMLRLAHDWDEESGHS